MNGVRRYSTDPTQARWEREFDELQRLCRIDFYSPTIGQLLDHGITRAEWRCRAWGTCWHNSEPFALAKFGRKLKVSHARRLFVCSKCGRNRPNLDLLPA